MVRYLFNMTDTVTAKPRRQNGKRSFSIVPSRILAWTAGGTPVSETEAMVALGWIFRRLAGWKTKANVFDLMRPGSGCGNSAAPALSLEGDSVFKHLRGLLSRLAEPEAHPEFVRFAREELGFVSLEQPILVPVRKPAGGVFAWLRNLYGCRLKQSPNEYHTEAYWLHGATLSLNSRLSRWRLHVTYSYRHEDSSWGISLHQMPGEKLEAFEARTWVWLRDQIAWRHDEAFYTGFFVSPDGMKRNELQSCARAEQEMFRLKDNLRGVFAWGVNAPGFWEREVAGPMVFDASKQFRDVAKIQMTGERLKVLAGWAEHDLAEAKARAAKQGR